MEIDLLTFLGRKAFDVINLHKNLIDANIVEFFTKNLWSTTLPFSWQTTLNDLNFDDFLQILQNETNFRLKIVLPLSLMSLKACIHCFSLNRTSRKSVPELFDCAQKISPAMPNEFKLHLTLKKQHEIIHVTEAVLHLHMIPQTTTNRLTVLDVGSGQGHLSRYLSGYHKLSVISIDADKYLITKANEFDEKLSKKGKMMNNPSIINAKLSHDEDLFEKFRDIHGILTGLHSCGDLSVIILQEFVRNSNIFSVLSLSCCYMKSTVAHDSEADCDHLEFPLSHIFKGQEPFSYFAKDLACHANEQLVTKLETGGNSNFLKIHCYRSLLELLLTEKYSNYTRKPLKSVKNAHLMNFSDYVKNVLKNNNEFVLNDDDLNSKFVENELKKFRNVATFFIVRQLFAPLIETVILIDRALYLKEHAYSNVFLFPIFDPNISARNLALLAFK